MLKNDQNENELLQTTEQWDEFADHTDNVTACITYLATSNAFTNSVDKIQEQFGDNAELFQQEILKLAQIQKEIYTYGYQHLPSFLHSPK